MNVFLALFSEFPIMICYRTSADASDRRWNTFQDLEIDFLVRPWKAFEEAVQPGEKPTSQDASRDFASVTA
jgi:hypothetical protein